MGKRVNYCCRSVISPDPYIATNEVGIPVQFAMTLHYPTPVNDWNVKYLRRLVERGANAYPGRSFASNDALVRNILPEAYSFLFTTVVTCSNLLRHRFLTTTASILGMH